MSTHYSHINKNTIDTLPWIEKFRPKILNDIVSNDKIISSFKHYVKNKCLPHILLHGPSGTGKTSTIHACAHELYGDDYDVMVLEINASEERGIEVVRNKIKEFVSSKSLFFNKSDMFKLVILDEADSMTGDAQSMLRRLIEDYTSNARFCLICNKIKSIDPAIQSRCTSFRFAPLPDDDIEKQIKRIGKEKNIKLTKDGIDAIIKIAKGDMRKVLNILQSTNMAYNIINAENVMTCMGYPKDEHMKEIYKSLMSDDFQTAVTVMTKIKNEYGYSLLEIITEIHSILLEKFIKKEIEQNFTTHVISRLKDIEINLMMCPSDSIQLSAIVGAFYP